jgi:molybdopterin-guanine dinucleotide biosynthesis protein A
MGRDKAALPFGGVPLATRIADLLECLFEEVLLVGGTPPTGAPGRPVPDPPGEPCALRGVVGALAAARAERVLVLSTDLPLVTPDLLLALVAYPEAEAVVPRTDRGAHPLCAVYRREPALAVAHAHLGDGRLRLADLLAALEVAWLEGPDLAAVDPDGDALTNLNTPEELAAAESRLEPDG